MSLIVKTISETMDDIEMFSVNFENVPIKERLLNAIRKHDFDSFKNELDSHYEDTKMFLNEMLLISCESSDKKEFVNILLRTRGIDVNYYDEIQKKAPIHLVIMNECEDTLHLLLNHPQIDVNLLDGDENSPLHLAAIAGNIYCTFFLLTHFKDIKPNQLNKYKLTPIYLASKSNKNKEELMSIYLRYFPLYSDIAFRENRLKDIEEVLKNCPTQISAIYYLYRNFEDDFISLLTLEKRVNWIDGNEGHGTDLQFACTRHLPKVVRALLKHGANPNGIHPYNRQFSLFIASYNGYADIVQIFIDTQNPEIIYQMNKKNMARINGCCYTSALHKVLSGSENNDSKLPEFCNYDKTFELLLTVIRDQWDINYLDLYGKSCLHIAGLINNQYYIHRLLDCGAYLGIVLDVQKDHY